MNKEEIEAKIEKNRNEIQKFLNSDLPLDIVYFNVRIFAKMNERLIEKLTNL